MFVVKKKSVFKIIIYTIVIVYVLLLTGSAFQNVYMTQLAQLNMFITFLIIIAFIYNRRGKLPKKSPDAIGVFVLYSFINFLICGFFWNETSYYNLYFTNIAIFVMAFLVCKSISYNDFIIYFENVILVFATVSLIGYFTDFFGFLPSRNIEGTFSYRTYYIYNVLLTNTERNCGFFWEPGMYQGILISAIVLLILNKEKFQFAYLRIILLVATVISTYSTTGYALLLAVVVLFFLHSIESKSRLLANVLIWVMVIILLLASNTGLIMDWFVTYMPSVVTDKIVNRDVSYNTRMFSMVYDFILAFRYPLGVGRLQLSRLVNEVAMEMGTLIAARTNTIGTAFVHFGLVGGVIYLYIWIKGIFGRKGSFAEKLLVFVIFMTIINTEPHMYTLLFNIFAFYWYRMSIKEKFDEPEAIYQE